MWSKSMSDQRVDWFMEVYINIFQIKLLPLVSDVVSSAEFCCLPEKKTKIEKKSFIYFKFQLNSLFVGIYLFLSKTNEKELKTQNSDLDNPISIKIKSKTF